MKHSQNTTLETLLDRLDAGETMAQIQSDLRGHDAASYLEIIDFLQAQRQTIAPNPEHLRQAIVQSALLKQAEHQAGWRQFSHFFSAWKPMAGIALSMLGIAVLTTDMWQPGSVTERGNAPVAALESAPIARLNVAADVVDDVALVQALEADFDVDLDDFYNTQAEFDSFLDDPLFSSLNPTQS